MISETSTKKAVKPPSFTELAINKLFTKKKNK